MGKMGRFDFKGLIEFQKQLERLQDPDAFVEECAKELAAELLARVIKRTPVGNYENSYELEDDGENKFLVMSDKKGGTLRRGWTGGEKADAKEYAKSLKISQSKAAYVIEIINGVQYASYVEYGHRQEPGRYVPALGKKLKQRWVKGRLMMTKSEQELEIIAPKMLENKIKKYFEGCLK